MLYPSKRNKEFIDLAVTWLLGKQEHDGAWGSSPILRIPSPITKNITLGDEWIINAKGTNVIISDQENIFTSAAAILALSVYLSVFT